MLGPYLLGPNDENQGIYTGDARELAEAIPDESVDLIFTDPVYDRIDDYRWLAESHVLSGDQCEIDGGHVEKLGLRDSHPEGFHRWPRRCFVG